MRNTNIILGAVVMIAAIFSGMVNVNAIADDVKADPFFNGPNQSLHDFDMYTAALFAWNQMTDAKVTVSSGQTFHFSHTKGIEAYQPVLYIPGELNTTWFRGNDAYQAKLIRTGN